MLTVTDKAVQYVRETLKKKSAPGAALRIVKIEEGYHLTLGEPKEGDQVFEYESEDYLLLDTEVGEALSSVAKAPGRGVAWCWESSSSWIFAGLKPQRLT